VRRLTTGSEDESIKYDTIKLADVRRNKTNHQADQTVMEAAGLDLVEDRNEKEKEKESPSPEKKLSPSEELVQLLVEQLLTDSMTTGDKEKEKTPDKAAGTSSQESSPTKTRGKNKKGNHSRNSSKKNKK